MKNVITFTAGEKINMGDIVFVSPATGLLMLLRSFGCKNCDPALDCPGRVKYLDRDDHCAECGKPRDPLVFFSSEGAIRQFGPKTDAAMAKYWFAKERVELSKLPFFEPK